MTAKQISLTNVLKPANTAISAKADTNTNISTEFFKQHLNAKLDTLISNENTKDSHDRQAERNKSTDRKDRTERSERELSRRDDRYEQNNDNRADKTEHQPDRKTSANNEERSTNDDQYNDTNNDETNANNKATSSDENLNEEGQSSSKEETQQTQAIDLNLVEEAALKSNEEVADSVAALTQTLSTDINKQKDATNIIASKGEITNLGSLENKVGADGLGKQGLGNQNNGLQSASQKFGEALESTLGTDASENTDGGEKGQQDTEKLNQLAKLASKGKEAANSIAAQNVTPNNAILTNQLATNPALQLASGSTKDLQLIQTSTKESGDLSGVITNNIDTKSGLPTNQVRSAGHTSPTQAIAVQIAQKAQNGIKQFDIRLNPPELGRVDVRLEFGKDGQISTHLIVERPETLDMLSKDARQLTKALSEAGVNVENDGLSFSLKDQDENTKEQNENKLVQTEQQSETIAETENNETIRHITLSDGLDISV